MSRVGKKPIEIPQGTEVHVKGSLVSVKGPKGELEREIRPEIGIEIKEGQVSTFPEKESKKTNAFWGLTNSLLRNMVEGVSQGFETKLQIEGIGYKATSEKENLILNLGFSHPVKMEMPEGVNFSIEKNIIILSGIDKQKVTQTAAKIRKIRPPEPYKGKGVRYVGEIVRRKTGKKAAGAGDK